MLLKIKVIPNSKTERVDKINEFELKVKVNTLAVNGKANEALIKILSSYFKVKHNQITILKGEKSPHKLIEVI